MIKLDLLGACHTCSNFEPIKTNEYNVMYMGKVAEVRCTVTCSNIDKCRVLLAHLRKEVNKNGN